MEPDLIRAANMTWHEEGEPYFAGYEFLMEALLAGRMWLSEL
jgi:hypothetical protein